MISVIVPVLDEEEVVGAAIDALAARAGEVPELEVIVVDGGSCDRTRDEVDKHGAILVEAERGRASQMNAGARAASGDVLLFLHADTRLPAGALAAIQRALADPEVVGGGFRKRYDRPGAVLAAMAWAQNRVRTPLLGRLVGTQAIFVRRAVFDRLGGYPDWPLLEDVALSDRLREAGRLALLPLVVTASARRYATRGPLRQAATNLLIMVLYRLGASPARLARLYR